MTYNSKSQLFLLPRHPQPITYSSSRKPSQSALSTPVALMCFWLGLLREIWILDTDPFSSPGSVSMLRVIQGLSTVSQSRYSLPSDAGTTSSRSGGQKLEAQSYPLFTNTATSFSSTQCQNGASTTWPPDSRRLQDLE